MPDPSSIANETGLLFYASIAFAGLSTFIVASTVFLSEEKFKAGEKLDDAEAKGDKDKNAGFVLKYSRPFFKRYISPSVAGMKNKKKIREKYKRKLANSGLTEELTPDDFFAFKLFLILGFPILYLAVREIGGMADWPMAAAPFTGIIGYFYPDIWLSGRIKQRQNDIVTNMPFVVDMLALSVEAGLDFMAAMSKVSEKAKRSALTEEIDIILKETKIGSSRAEALRNFSWRTNVLQIASFCATLIAADSVGASIGPILKTLAAEMRQKKSADVEKRGAQAATKILFPMLFLIVPAVFIVIAAPIALEMINQPK